MTHDDVVFMVMKSLLILVGEGRQTCGFGFLGPDAFAATKEEYDNDIIAFDPMFLNHDHEIVICGIKFAKMNHNGIALLHEPASP